VCCADLQNKQREICGAIWRNLCNLWTIEIGFNFFIFIYKDIKEKVMKKSVLGFVIAAAVVLGAVFFGVVGCDVSADGVSGLVNNGGSGGNGTGGNGGGSGGNGTGSGGDNPPAGSSGGGGPDVQFKAGASLPESAYLGKSGQGTDNIVWNLKVLDQRYVYFGVKKTAEQTVTVKHADWVTPEGAVPVTAVENEPEEGAIEDATPLAASETLAVFRVDANRVHNDKRDDVATDADAKYDTQFEGDDFTMTLNVAEGSSAKTVTVQLRAEVTLDNALFVVNTTTGALSRVTGIKHITDINGGNITWDETAPGTELLDMLVWADKNYLLADNGTGEYLVRAANVGNETFPMMIFTFAENNTSTKLRLRGTGKEQIIKWNGTSKKNGTRYYYNAAASTNESKPGNTSSDIQGFIAMRRGTLQLEKNITIQGASTYDTNASKYLIAVANGPLIMKEGAALTKHTGSGSKSTSSCNNVLIYLYGASALFRMEGGEISENTDIMGIAYFTSTAGPAGSFLQTGGAIKNNTAPSGYDTPITRVLYGNQSLSADAKYNNRRLALVNAENGGPNFLPAQAF
jgi:hypothetical protein